MQKNKNMWTPLGLTDHLAEKASAFPDLFPGRVGSARKGLYRVWTEDGEAVAEASGRLRHKAADPSAFPAVGDFVLLDRTGNAAETPSSVGFLLAVPSLPAEPPVRAA